MTTKDPERDPTPWPNPPDETSFIPGDICRCLSLPHLPGCPERMADSAPSLSYTEHRRRLIDYLLAKVALCDWHGVSDAANDLRELEATERGRQQR